MKTSRFPPRHVSLFSGIGGLDLAAEWAGFKTVLFVERDPYAQRVLSKHWPKVPIIDDIRKVHNESAKGPIHLLSGGFPCQPFSHAGKRRGTEDDRYLWPEMFRVIHELAPKWVVAENVPGLLSIDGGMVFETVCLDLEGEGYEILPLVYPAAGVGANHKRDRVFIVAHSVKFGRGRRDYGDERRNGGEVQITGSGSGEKPGILADAASYRRIGERERIETEKRLQPRPGTARKLAGGLEGLCEDVADAESKQSGRIFKRQFQADSRAMCYRGTSSGWWQSEPDVGRVAHGIPYRVDRLKCLGNAVVPAQAYQVFRVIREFL